MEKYEVSGEYRSGLMPKKLIIIFAGVFLILSIILGVYLVRQRTQLKSKASADTAILAFVPATAAANLAQDVSFTISFNKGTGVKQPAITGVDLRISIDNPNMRIVSFTPDTTSSKFNTQLRQPEVSADGTTFRYTAINTADTASLPAGQVVILGTLVVRTTAAGTASLRFDNTTQVVASGYKDAVPLDLTRTGVVTIAGPTASPVSSVCPADITSTQAKLRTSTQDTWGTEKTIALGESVFVGGFHNNNINPPFVSDTRLKTTGPAGATSHEDSLNNLDDTDLGNDNNLSYTPTEAGRYTIAAVVKDKTGGSCVGSAILTVNTPVVVTSSFRVAEDPSQFTDALLWQPYTGVPMPVDFTFSDKTPGNRFIWVEFKDSSNKIERRNVQIKLLGVEPTITSCALSFEGNNTVLNLTGQNLGTVKGTAKSDETNLQVSEWKNTSAKVIWPNAPLGQTLSATLTTPDGQQALANCSSVSQLSVGAKVFCRAPLSHDTENVNLVLAGLFEGGKKLPQKVRIDKDGIVLGLTQKLEAGKKYKLSLKAPKSLRKLSPEFIAGEGTTNLNFVLPVGDIFPPDGGDGVINSNDYHALVSQWNISGDTRGKSADLNQDERVNSIDYACMRYDFNARDDSEPAAGGPAPSPSLSPNLSPSPSASSSASPSASLTYLRR